MRTAAAAVLLLTLLTGTAIGHGGAYRGPKGVIPIGSRDPKDPPYPPTRERPGPPPAGSGAATGTGTSSRSRPRSRADGPLIRLSDDVMWRMTVSSMEEILTIP